jgi:nucleoside-diphosphate-sugar epimerase
MDAKGVWFHEAIRAVGSFPGLPVVVLRHALLYGPGMLHTECKSQCLIEYPHHDLTHVP